MSEPARPFPVPEDGDATYWEAARRHELVMQRCGSCGRFRFTPRPMCPFCQSWEFAWSPVSGKGVIHSWVVVHPPVLPFFQDKTPYAVALIQLEEGPRMVSNVIDVDRGDMAMDMPVRVDFMDLEDGVTLPVFRRA